MSRSLRAFNGLLAAISTLLVVYIVRELVTPFGTPSPVQPAAVAAMVSDSPSLPTAVVSPARNTLIVARNLFSPDRSDRPRGGAGTAGAPAMARVKPQLFGVVLGQIATAYLEDPITKHVGGYRVGEVVAGASIRAIEADRVVLERLAIASTSVCAIPLGSGPPRPLRARRRAHLTASRLRAAPTARQR